MSILMKTAFIDDYQARIKALGAMETDCGYFDLHTMVQSVKTSSDIVMSSSMMQELQQLMCGKSNNSMYVYYWHYIYVTRFAKTRHNGAY